jgi:hypothetical protein
MFAIALVLGSLAVAAVILLYPAPPGASRPWALRSSWALWCLQPALLLSALLLSIVILESMGYTTQNAPADVDAWISFVIAGPVGAGLLAGTVLGGLAWRSARSEPTHRSHRRWALTALVANALWFAGGAWLLLATPVAVGLDVLIVVVVLALLLWPQQHAVAEAIGPTDAAAGPAAPVEATDEHLVG